MSMEFFDEKTARLIRTQMRILTNIFAIFCIIDSEILLIGGILFPQIMVEEGIVIGWEVIQILALGISIIILDSMRELLNPEPNK